MRGHSDQPEDQQSLMDTHRNQYRPSCQSSRVPLAALAEALLAGADYLRLFFRGYQGFFSLGFLGQEKATELVEEKATELVEDRLGETALGCRHLPCLDCRHLSFLGHLDAVPYLDHLEADQ